MTSIFTSILVSGLDARPFLQGQISFDMDQLPSRSPQYASVNSPQGRVQAVLRLSENDAGIALSVVSEMAEPTLQRLRKYVLRSKVKLEIEHAPPATDSLLEQIRAGIPHVFAATHEAFVAQMLNLDLIGAISFDKGCYTGQEIIARTHFRGAIKRRMFRFAADSPPPPPGHRLLTNGAHAGDVVYGAAAGEGCEFLAVINLAQLDSVIQLEDRPGTRVQRLELPYSVTGAN